MPQQKDLITVIVPFFNTAQYLPECIESIQKQTYSNLQIILIDDGSTDTSLQICRKYAESDQRIIVLQQKHAGVSVARNLGLDYAHGAYVSFIDSDDSVLPEYIENLHCAITRCDVAIVIAPFTIDGICIVNYRFSKNEEEKIVPMNELAYVYWLQGAGGTMIRTSDIADVRFDSEICFSEDKLFNLKIILGSKSGKVLYVKNEFGYIYRMRADSATHSKGLRLLQSRIKATQKMLALTNGMIIEQDLRRELAEMLTYQYTMMVEDPKTDKKICRDKRKQAVGALRVCERDALSVKRRIKLILYLYHFGWVHKIYLRLKHHFTE